MQYGIREAFRFPEDIKACGLTGGLDGKRVAVQGFGNVGYHVAKLLSKSVLIVVTARARLRRACTVATSPWVSRLQLQPVASPLVVSLAS